MDWDFGKTLVGWLFVLMLPLGLCSALQSSELGDAIVESSCWHNLIDAYHGKFDDGATDLIIPEVVREGRRKGFYVRIAFEEASGRFYRFSSLREALFNPNVAPLLMDLGFSASITKEEYTQIILSLPVPSTIRARIKKIEQSGGLQFGFIPEFVQGGILSRLDWLREISEGRFPIWRTGEAFQHEFHDHALFFFGIDPTTASWIKDVLKIGFGILKDKEAPHQTVKSMTRWLEHFAYVLEVEGRAIHDLAAIVDSRVHRSPFKTPLGRRMREHFESLFNQTPPLEVPAHFLVLFQPGLRPDSSKASVNILRRLQKGS